LCENAQEPTRKSIIFSIDLFPIAATAIFLFRLTKLRKTFYAQIECLHGLHPQRPFRVAGSDAGPCPISAIGGLLGDGV
jgi:hypothetical protein